MNLTERMRQESYDGYTYAYPHKTAYRPLDPPVGLAEAWREEDTSRLFLYTHLPFCEMRCGFCNLFTTIRPGQDRVEATLAAILRQSRSVAEAVRPLGVAQAAFGGGTPSYLTEAQLERLFGGLQKDWPVDFRAIPVSFETSPGTVTPTKLALLKQLGVDRLSLGVQSFEVEDLADLTRPQPAGQLRQACEWIRAAGFPVFNIDLIYGNPRQDERSWEASLRAALEWRPEELYLYPLYVGKLTGLDKLGRRPGERRRALYRQARDLLLSCGYRQVSMRLFRLPQVELETDYCCQQDGMVGLGPGARSYTRELHYSSEYAVGQAGVRAIIEDFCGRSQAQFAQADYGFLLNASEQHLRRLLKTLLRNQSLDFEPGLPQLHELEALGLARSGPWRLTEEGLAWSDTIGPWLYSEAVQELMREYELR
ncbi:MAG: STM4012 family radical SAM protein [Candidatus Eremiobacteraeota bacterium]|nr:STM4012 family radical SAM protein [Candidatus Eremiobacteraeota bacterium]